MFVIADGLVFACGSNSCGRHRRQVPTLVTGQLQGKRAVYAAVGDDHTLCITADGSLADGSLFGWGRVSIRNLQELTEH